MLSHPVDVQSSTPHYPRANPRLAIIRINQVVELGMLFQESRDKRATRHDQQMVFLRIPQAGSGELASETFTFQGR